MSSHARRSYSPRDDPAKQQQQQPPITVTASATDPYNQERHQRPIYLDEPYLDEAMHEPQVAYDSMSTILEVDSEGSSGELSPREQLDSPERSTLRAESPLQVRTSGSQLSSRSQELAKLTGSSTRSRAEQADEGRVSPVGLGLSPAAERFSGTLSALAEQVERLRRSASSGEPGAGDRRAGDERNDLSDRSNSNSNSITDHHDHNDDIKESSSLSGATSVSVASSAQRDASTSPLLSPSNPSEGVDTPGDPPEWASPKWREPVGRQRARQAQESLSVASGGSRVCSPGESLMMIALSPMVSPRVKLPPQPVPSEDRRVVEVSNKSTVTAIDLRLMERMVEKYFVEMRDKGTQSVEFDCEQELDIIDFSNGNARGRHKPSINTKANTKSVAVGTETFSRERFSLLPPTKTRSTQTKSFTDHDIGTSETRRFKLAHLDLGPVIRGGSLAGAARQESSTGNSQAATDQAAATDTGRPQAVAGSLARRELESGTLPAGRTEAGPPGATDGAAGNAATDQREGRPREQVEGASQHHHQQAKQQQQQQQRSQMDQAAREARNLFDSSGEVRAKVQVTPSGHERERQQQQQQSATLRQPRPSGSARATPTPEPDRDSLAGEWAGPVRNSDQAAKATAAGGLSQRGRATPTAEDSLSPPATGVDSSSSLAATPGRSSSSLDERSSPNGATNASHSNSPHDSLQERPESGGKGRITAGLSGPGKTQGASATPSEAASKQVSSNGIKNGEGEKGTGGSGEMGAPKKAADSNSGPPGESGDFVSRATIPSVKTELRVIIEIQDSKRRHTSEVLSNSQLLSNGRLSKRTQVSTSRQVAATPRQVFDRLTSAGREHSLMYQEQQQSGHHGRQEQTQQAGSRGSPASLAAANQSALKWPSSTSSLPGSGGPSLVGPGPGPGTGKSGTSAGTGTGASTGTGKSGDRGGGSLGWREVSKSSVVNEIETDTRRSVGGSHAGAIEASRGLLKASEAAKEIGGGGQVGEGDIVMSSNATINHMANERSAIEVRSRAARRYEAMERDARTGQLIGSGEVREQTLVESEAGFNDDHADQERLDEVGGKLGANLASNNLSNSQTLGRRLGARTPVRFTGLPGSAGEALERSGSGEPARQQEEEEEEEQQQRPRHRSESSKLAKNFSASLNEVQINPPPQPPLRPAKLSPGGPKVSSRIVPPPVSPVRTARIEIEQESEERKQVSKNGRLVYDDRLSERRYEIQRSPSGGPQVGGQVRQVRPHLAGSLSGSPGVLSPVPPLSPGGQAARAPARTQVNQAGARQTVKPGGQWPRQGSQANNNLLYADQTSNLSSDPETMDSGFAQSGAGSGSQLNQSGRQLREQRQRLPLAGSSPELLMSPRLQPLLGSGGLGNISEQQRSTAAAVRQQRQAAQRAASSMELMDEAASLTYVDDDADELIDQLDSSRMLSPEPMAAAWPGEEHPRRMLERAQEQRHRRPVDLRREKERPAAPASRQTSQEAEVARNYLISPPPAFRSNELAGTSEGRQFEPANLSRPAVGGGGGGGKHSNSPAAPAQPKVKASGAAVEAQTDANKTSISSSSKDTHLTTRLTRTKRHHQRSQNSQNGPDKVAPDTPTAGNKKNQLKPARTTTKFEQSIVAPAQVGTGGTNHVEAGSRLRQRPEQQSGGVNRQAQGQCRFKAQVVFESDTDSLADRQSSSVASSRGSLRKRSQELAAAAAGLMVTSSGGSGAARRSIKKELHSETKYSRRDSAAPPPPGQVGVAGLDQVLEAEAGSGQARLIAGAGGPTGGLEPRWDYSLRVNRMRGNKVDSKVNTYIRHSRGQALINSEAS